MGYCQFLGKQMLRNRWGCHDRSHYPNILLRYDQALLNHDDLRHHDLNVDGAFVCVTNRMTIYFHFIDQQQKVHINHHKLYTHRCSCIGSAEICADCCCTWDLLSFCDVWYSVVSDGLCWYNTAVLGLSVCVLVWIKTASKKMDKLKKKKNCS